MITVRRVGLEAAPQLLSLGERMRAESRIAFPEIDEAAAREFLAQAGDLYFMALAERDGEAVGFICAMLSRHLFSREVYVTHDIFYVCPEARGGRAAVLLVDAMEAWGVSAGARKSFIGVHTGLKPEVTGRFYQKRGYEFMGGNFVKRL